MNVTVLLRVAVATVVATSLGARAESPSMHEAAMIVFKPLPTQYDSPENPVTPAKVELGKYLFFDKRLSKSQALSCASCHDLARFGVDGLPTSSGHKGQLGRRNSQSVYNTGSHIALFWDGRAKSIEEQAKGPLLNPLEMAMPDGAAVEKVVRSIPGYAPMFTRAFPDAKEPITFDTITLAIAAFERTLVTPSKFDTYLRGTEKALSEEERQGLLTFMSLGCMVCHKGEGIGGGMFQALGFAVRVPPEFMADLGRYEATKKDEDKNRFRVPSLRNIEKTAPYLHDGSLKTLEETVVFMGKYQLGKDVTKEEQTSIVTFLKSLTGQLPKIVAPAPLPSGKDTPKPDTN